uniref:PIH1 N-terminal domain-containing protein n=1 Tax=Chromera velia CCMP2878 TaxID=1169474 RepID=A0A0G4I2C9_9ALVE|mmetsp:Transcript_30671/g.60371  ORF Transcript_30671/g.60371 Transcript_30671/m.60371 type:complete len:498 (-) Transcript_30671:95-1588(-)|eukprot:Cvel_10302.t1-p1 / transcript=Cvel_10302.t1 / gene=Cvel_10302 / organism=Chromera_velia_CCMP2878 / gene_product=hypothetical protein / transcript_product=hypothetical protein / location=Cvel_scaffold618:41975-46134(-) / protein_length=497 / sequence_SO=supercontig / SO=protein_coding / is_pseudo=false
MQAEMNPFLAEELFSGEKQREHFKEYMQSFMKGNIGKTDAEGGTLVLPEAVFVIKTKDLSATFPYTEDASSSVIKSNSRQALPSMPHFAGAPQTDNSAVDGQKVFINVVGSEKIGAIHAKKMLAEELGGETGEEDQDALRFPLSILNPREETDKQTQPCIAIDVMLNIDLAKNAVQNTDLRNHIAWLLLEAIQKKFGLRLDPRVSFPKMKYKGTDPEIHRVRLKKEEGIIQEVTSSSSSSPAEEPSAVPSKGAQVDRQGGEKPRRAPVVQPEVCVHYIRPSCNDDRGVLETVGEEEEEEELIDGLELPLFQKEGDATPFDFQKALKFAKQRAEAEEKGGEGMKGTDEGGAPDPIAGCECRVSIRMPLLFDFLSNGRKGVIDGWEGFSCSSRTFTVAISDEGLRVIWNRQARAPEESQNPPYPPLSVWFPRRFCSNHAECEWDGKEKKLLVRIACDQEALRRKQGLRPCETDGIGTEGSKEGGEKETGLLASLMEEVF